MKITVIKNNKIENFDLKEIHLKNKDLSKNIPTTKSSHREHP